MYYINMLLPFGGCRYTFTILSNLVVFSCFWVLLEKINHDVDVTNLTPNDKTLFWVSISHCSLIMHILLHSRECSMARYYTSV